MRKNSLFFSLLLSAGIGLFILNHVVKTSPIDKLTPVHESKQQNVKMHSLRKDGKYAEKTNAVSDRAFDPTELEIEQVPHWSRQRKNEELKWYRARRDGAEAKIVFHVVNSMGMNVPDAGITASLLGSKKVVTDENGLFTATGLIRRELAYSVEKDRYYTTQASCKLGMKYGDDVRNGKWFPESRVIDVTLKEKRNPIPMYVKNANIRLPKQGEPFGYDFEKGDMVAPHGTGEMADLFFTCSATDWDAPDFRKELRIVAAQQGGGMIANAKDTYSQFQSRHEAQQDGYGPQLEFVMDKKKREAVSLDPDADETFTHYLTFRSRIKRNEKGDIVSARYGKIFLHPNTGHSGFSKDPDNPEGAVVSLQYYFNPTPNDRNIEFDIDKNLFKVKDLDRVMSP